MLYYNSLLIHRLTFLKTVVNPFFLIGAVTQMDSRSSTSKCEVFAQRYDVSMKMCVIVLEFANRIMHRCFHFHRSCYHFCRTWYRFHRRWSSDVWKIRRGHSCKRRFLRCIQYLFSYLKFCVYHVHDARWRDLEIPWWLALNETI